MVSCYQGLQLCIVLRFSSLELSNLLCKLSKLQGSVH